MAIRRFKGNEYGNVAGGTPQISHHYDNKNAHAVTLNGKDDVLLYADFLAETLPENQKYFVTVDKDDFDWEIVPASKAEWLDSYYYKNEDAWESPQRQCLDTNNLEAFKAFCRKRGVSPTESAYKFQ